MTEKQKKPRSTKTPKELEMVHVAKIEHAVQNTVKWIDKVVKLTNSRKYDIGMDKKNYILKHVGEKFDLAAEQIRGQKKVETEKFKLT